MDNSFHQSINLYKEVEIPRRQKAAQSNFLGSLPKFIIEAFGISIIIFSAINMTIDSDEGLSIFGLLATFALGAQKLLPAMQQLYASLNSIRLFSFSIKNVLLLKMFICA